ncbi:MAG: glycoside hydrolase family 5 protein [Polyangiales bacterium]
MSRTLFNAGFAVVMVAVAVASSGMAGCSQSTPAALDAGVLPASSAGSSAVAPAAGGAEAGRAGDGASAGVGVGVAPSVTGGAGAPGPSALPGSAGASGVPASGAGTSGASAAGAAGLAGIGAAGSGSVAPSMIGPVPQHGALHVEGTKVVDAKDEPIQLRGMSLFWSQWSDYYTVNTVDQLVDDWHVTLVRAVLGVENGGYLEEPADNEAKVTAVVERAIARGVYVIIDWHDHHAEAHQAEAIAFFTRMATKYGATPHVLFEIYNEPLEVPWASVKGYAEAVIAAIRGAGAKNVVIVGTPTWSQDVDIAAENPITTDDNVAYTLHFYAATHKEYLREKARKALAAGVALFVTEWGTCESTGDGVVDEGETKAWLELLTEQDIGWANWSLNTKAEACSALTPTASPTGPWTGSALTQSGSLVKARIP